MEKLPAITWTDKVSANNAHELKITEQDEGEIPAGALVLLPSATMIDRYIRQIPEGKSVSPEQLRQDLAREYGADHTAPEPTGQHLRIVAEAAFEQHHLGATLEDITPFWRVLTPESPVARTLSFGTAFLQELRRQENL